MSVAGAQISGVARSVAPSVPGYVAAFALIGAVLLGALAALLFRGLRTPDAAAWLDQP